MGMHLPLFRKYFVNQTFWSKDPCNQIGQGRREDGLGDSSAASGAKGGRGGSLMRPLLIIPSREELTTPSETMLKKQKFAIYEKQCSKVAEGLYVSGEAVARDRSLLAAHSITHIVNCVGALYQEYYKDDGIQYKTLWLNDIPGEDITSILYDTFDFIEAARKGPAAPLPQQPPAAAAAAAGLPGSLQQHDQQQPACSSPAAAQQQQQHQWQQALPPALQQEQHAPGELMQWSSCSTGAAAAASSSSSGGGRVLVHCSQGVSRSTTIAIAYLMMKTGGSYEEVYTTVRSLRGVTSPNVGFMCQLIQWANRRQHPPKRLRMYRLAPHCPDAPTYLVAKAVTPPRGSSHADWTLLDYRGCFLLHLPQRLYVWCGSECGPQLREAGLRAAAGLVRYEGVPAPELVKQGDEPYELLLALSPDCGGCSSTAAPDSALASLEQSAVSISAAAAGGGGTMEDEESLSRVPSAAGTWPCSAQQQQQQPPWLSGETGNAGSGTACCSDAAVAACPAGAAAAGSREGDAAAAGDAAVLAPQFSASGLQWVVTQVEEYSRDYEMLLRALIKSGQCSDAGRLTPRGSRAGLATDDMAVGSSSSGGGGGGGGSSPGGCSGGGGGGGGGNRCDSPGPSEGQQQKRTRYRRSERESGCGGASSFRQPGRLSAASSAVTWPAVTAEVAVAAAPVAAVAADTAAEPAGAAAGVDAGEEQGCDIKRMSIDEGCE